jgi:hypothetical protein
MHIDMAKERMRWISKLVWIKIIVKEEGYMRSLRSWIHIRQDLWDQEGHIQVSKGHLRLPLGHAWGPEGAHKIHQSAHRSFNSTKVFTPNEQNM